VVLFKQLTLLEYLFWVTNNLCPFNRSSKERFRCWFEICVCANFSNNMSQLCVS